MSKETNIKLGRQVEWQGKEIASSENIKYESLLMTCRALLRLVTEGLKAEDENMTEILIDCIGMANVLCTIMKTLGKSVSDPCLIAKEDELRKLSKDLAERENEKNQLDEKTNEIKIKEKNVSEDVLSLRNSLNNYEKEYLRKEEEKKKILNDIESYRKNGELVVQEIENLKKEYKELIAANDAFKRIKEGLLDEGHMNESDYLAKAQSMEERTEGLIGEYENFLVKVIHDQDDVYEKIKERNGYATFGKQKA